MFYSLKAKTNLRHAQTRHQLSVSPSPPWAESHFATARKTCQPQIPKPLKTQLSSKPNGCFFGFGFRRFAATALFCALFNIPSREEHSTWPSHSHMHFRLKFFPMLAGFGSTALVCCSISSLQFIKQKFYEVSSLTLRRDVDSK